MQTRNPNIGAATRRVEISSPPHPAVDAPLNGERIRADAPITRGKDPTPPLSDSGSIEYASWLCLLRGMTP